MYSETLVKSREFLLYSQHDRCTDTAASSLDCRPAVMDDSASRVPVAADWARGWPWVDKISKSTFLQEQGKQGDLLGHVFPKPDSLQIPDDTSPWPIGADKGAGSSLLSFDTSESHEQYVLYVTSSPAVTSERVETILFPRLLVIFVSLVTSFLSFSISQKLENTFLKLLHKPYIMKQINTNVKKKTLHKACKLAREKEKQATKTKEFCAVSLAVRKQSSKPWEGR